jgi:hypothetical protein
MSERSAVYVMEPRMEGFGTSRLWQRTIQGRLYSFTAVLMPNGERRYFASRFNGYSGGPAFACAWDPCFEHTVPPRRMKCYSYPCKAEAVYWMEWQTTGRPKGAPICAEHKVERDIPDNWGHHPTFAPL